VIQELELEDGGTLRLYDPWLAPQEAAECMAVLERTIPWQQRVLRIAGRAIAEPRLTAWFGDDEAKYSYSGLDLDPLPWTSELGALRGRVERAAGIRFNSVLLNFYRDGNDGVGYHADDEKELGKNPVIASVSLGATRRFVLQHRRRKDIARVELGLKSGTLIVMGGTTQHFWRHSLPKQKSPVGPRVNLTFRRIEAPQRRCVGEG
jgi:alkylated DNA repair dioxygenase AlkB